MALIAIWVAARRNLDRAGSPQRARSKTMQGTTSLQTEAFLLAARLRPAASIAHCYMPKLGYMTPTRTGKRICRRVFIRTWRRRRQRITLVLRHAKAMKQLKQNPLRGRPPRPSRPFHPHCSSTDTAMPLAGWSKGPRFALLTEQARGGRWQVPARVSQADESRGWP